MFSQITDSFRIGKIDLIHIITINSTAAKLNVVISCMNSRLTTYIGTGNILDLAFNNRTGQSSVFCHPFTNSHRTQMYFKMKPSQSATLLNIGRKHLSFFTLCLNSLSPSTFKSYQDYYSIEEISLNMVEEQLCWRNTSFLCFKKAELNCL